jgi:hypothetical protein
LPLRRTTLSPIEIDRFHEDGYLVVRGAFARADALRMQAEWWAELAEVHGVRRDDRSTWRRVLPDLRRAKASPGQQAIATPRVRGVIDDLLGVGTWRLPNDWGRAIATFPETGDWDVPSDGWHWDSPVEWHRKRLEGLFVVSFIGEVVARAGGTLIIAGSPRLLTRHEAQLTADERRADFRRQKDLFLRSHPWLAALGGKAASPRDRIATFMGAETDVDGIPARVVELTGEPGDMVFCHPAIVHSAAPNRGDQPRFMRIKQQVMTEVGRGVLRGEKPAG